MALCCASSLACTQQGLQLRPEILVQPTVNEGIVASAAHGKPVESKVQSIAAVDGPAGDQHHVAVQGKPADCKHNHHHHQHLQRHLLLPLMGVVLLHSDVPNGISQPELLSHDGIGNGDHKQGQNIQENKCSQVQILPEKVSRRREAGEANRSYCSVPGIRGRELSVPQHIAQHMQDTLMHLSKGTGSGTHSVTWVRASLENSMLNLSFGLSGNILNVSSENINALMLKSISLLCLTQMTALNL